MLIIVVLHCQNHLFVSEIRVVSLIEPSQHGGLCRSRTRLGNFDIVAVSSIDLFTALIESTQYMSKLHFSVSFSASHRPLKAENVFGSILATDDGVLLSCFRSLQ